MQFRETDEEIFEDDPEEFIRRDIEGSGRRFSYCQNVPLPTPSNVSSSPHTCNFSPTCSITDIETRRRAAYDLIRGLCKCFEAEVTGVFSEYVTQLLAVRQARHLSTRCPYTGHPLVPKRVS